MRHLPWLAIALVLGCVPRVRPLPTRGERGVFTFGYQSTVGQSLDTPVAVGAVVGLEMEEGGATPNVTDFHPEDPTIVEVQPADQSHGLRVHGLAPGSTEIDVDFNADRVRVVIEAPDAIEFSRGWGAAPGPTVVAGGAERYWVRLLHAGQALAGNGATRFTYAGPLVSAGEFQAPSDFIPDSEENFAVGTGAGSATITATSGAASAVLPVTVIDASAITGAIVTTGLRPLSGGLGHGCSGVQVTPVAGTTPIYGARCAQVNDLPSTFNCVAPVDAPMTPDQGGWTGTVPGTCYQVCAPTTCTLAPSLLTIQLPQ
jgi:hypothetical protein